MKFKNFIVFCFSVILLLILAGNLIYRWRTQTDTKQTDLVVVLNPKEALEKIKGQNPDVFAAIRDQLPDILKANGAGGTIEIINQGVSDKELNFSQCHSLLHLLGHASYKFYHGDINRIVAYINNTCYSGFIHGFEAQIAYQNPEPKEELLALCIAAKNKDRNTACLHGAGHAFLEITHDVQASLNKCDELYTQEYPDTTQCYGGVFSEYGNLLTGYDGDTGLRIPGDRPAEASSDHPMEFCQKFNSRYQIQCAIQLVKLKYDYTSIEKSLTECVWPAYTASTKKQCMIISGNYYAETELFDHGYIVVPKGLQAYPKDLKYAFIEGVRQSFDTSLHSDVKTQPDLFCGSFKLSADQQYCRMQLTKYY